MSLRWHGHTRLFFVLATVICSLTTGCQSAHRLAIPADASFVDVHGRVQQPVACTAVATTLIFITNDCPIANSYAPEINHIVREYEPRGVEFYLVHVDASLPANQARQHAEDYGYVCPVLMDPRHQLVHAVGATRTPEAAVISTSRRVEYIGRIDDRYIDFGKKRFTPTKRDLRDALDAVLDGRAVTNPRVMPVGCDIPDVR